MVSDLYAPVVMSYIDPGTGSMLFTILIGAISVVVYGLRGFFIKLRYSLTGKRNVENDNIPYAIYCDDKRYWTTFRPICEEMEKRHVPIVYMSQSEDDPAFKEKYEYVKCEYIGEGNRGFAKLNMLNADIVLSTTPSLDIYQWKRSKKVKWYIHVLHMANDVTSYRMFGLDYYDALILSGDYQVEQIRKLEKLRGLKEKELLVLGLPYLDELKKRKDKEKSIVSDKKTVLLAPSWGDNGILSKYGSRMIDALIATGYRVIIRPHPQSFVSEKQMIDELMKKYPQSNDLEWNRDNDNFDVLNRSDILISDFSGVIFDFSLVFDKPIIYADVSFDKSVYDAWWLDEEMWTFKALPKLGKQLKDEDLNDIKVLIDNCLDSQEMKKSREEIKKECWSNIGNSAKLIADYMVNKHRQLEEDKR